MAIPSSPREKRTSFDKELYERDLRSQVEADNHRQTVNIDSGTVPTVDLGGLVVYDALVMRASVDKRGLRRQPRRLRSRNQECLRSNSTHRLRHPMRPSLAR